MLSRKDGFPHQEPNKIWFAFLWFFYNFLRILQGTAETLVMHLQGDPCLKLQIHESVPALHKTPCIKPNPCNAAPGADWTSPAAGIPAGDGRTWPDEVPGVPMALTRVGLRRNPGRTCRRRVSGIHPGYSCKEGGRVEDGLLLEFPCTPTRTPAL
jgi:hypothetical protein